MAERRAGRHPQDAVKRDLTLLGDAPGATGVETPRQTTTVTPEPGSLTTSLPLRLGCGRLRRGAPGAGSERMRSVQDKVNADCRSAPATRKPAPNEPGRSVVVPSGSVPATRPGARSSRNAGVSSVPARTTAGRAAFDAERSSRALTAAPKAGARCVERRRLMIAILSYPDGSVCTLRPLLRRWGCALARERTRRRRARRLADATPNTTRSAGPRDPRVSSTGMPPTCARGAPIIGRSRLCSRRRAGAPRGLVRDRRGGHRSQGRSPGRSPCRRQASS
jgi:hypothetical protein